MECRKLAGFGTGASEFSWAVARPRGKPSRGSAGARAHRFADRLLGVAAELPESLEPGGAARHRVLDLAHDEGIERPEPLDVRPEDPEPVEGPRRVAAARPVLDLPERRRQAVARQTERIEGARGLEEGLGGV